MGSKTLKPQLQTLLRTLDWYGAGLRRGVISSLVTGSGDCDILLSFISLKQKVIV